LQTSDHRVKTSTFSSLPQTSLTDPRGLQAQFRYDGTNRVTEIADARQGLTRFSYDQNGNLLTVTDAKNQQTTYTYDAMDRLATRKDALNRPESYQYDVAGNLSQFTDRKNQQTTFEYDGLNRRTKAQYQGDGTETTFVYDAVGRLTKASDTATGAGTIDFAYDTLDRLIQEVTGQGTVSYQYDVLGRRTQMVANGQQPVTYGYDAASRLTQVAQGSLTVGLGYDNANRRTSLTYPNGTSTSYVYDVASRLTNINHLGPSGIIEALTYQYDAAGNRTSLTRNNAAASLLPAAVASATYDVANEQTAFAGATLTYDSNGNLTNDGTNTYVWDARNRLASISGGATASFNYDALGRRVHKTRSTPLPAVSTTFLYDGNDIAAEIGGGAVGANYLRSLNIDEPFVRQTGTGNEFYHTDALGSSLVMSNAQGDSGTTYTYEPFGKTTVSDTSANPFQYTGRENDGTGLLYYRTRYYSPTFSRFVSRDSIGFGGGINVYAYVGNSPNHWIDPMGLDKCENDSGAGTNALIDTGVFVGQQLGDAGTVRNDYQAAVNSLDPNDSQGRSAAKAAARANTPPLVRYPLQSLRPGLGPNTGSTGSANVSNPSVNALGRALQVGGRGLLAVSVAADVHDVATSCKPFRSLMSASFGVLGSIAGGSAGAVGGSFVTPFVGTVAGGIGGAAAGGAFGRSIGSTFYNYVVGQ
ncbi:RHS repeat domain-containing protein, partial [Nitrospira sp. BLG_1]|uniref:RHS repeat domain-containing protein n=1 Tax=Nitrospira sp. BLG_1 TaxID=3395883 RepID=UPI0039BCA72F